MTFLTNYSFYKCFYILFWNKLIVNAKSRCVKIKYRNKKKGIFIQVMTKKLERTIIYYLNINIRLFNCTEL